MASVKGEGRAGEVVTLQLGGGANHVGSHLWNLVLEEEAHRSPGGATSQDLSVLLAETKTGERQPRTACFDLSGTVSTSYGSGSEESAAETWSTDRISVSLAEGGHGGWTGDEAGAGYRGYWDEYMNLGHQGRWRSQLITCFPGTWHGVNAFDCYGDGIELFSRQDVREGAFDRVRHLVERCDYLQGFQILADDLSGFGHICSEMILHIRDEVTQSRPLAVVGLRGPFAQDYTVQSNRSETKQAALDCINRAWATYRLSEASDAHIVLDNCWFPPGGESQAGTELYETSALAACLVDSLTLGCRLFGSASLGSLRDIMTRLNPRGKKCALAACAYGVVKQGDPEAEVVLRSATRVCPASKLDKGTQSEYYVLRGLQKGGEAGGTISTEREAQDWFVSQWIEGGGGQLGPCPRSFASCGTPHLVPAHYPSTKILSPSARAPVQGGFSLASMVRFSKCDALGNELASLCENFKRICVKPGSPSVFSVLEGWDLGAEDRQEMMETLETMRSEWAGGNFFDDDD